MSGTASPAIPFAGRLLTGTAWFESYFHGENVGILATGAEAASILPEVLHTAARVTLFEEHPTWVSPVALPTGVLSRLASRVYLRAAVRDAWTRRNLTPHRFDSDRVQVSPSYYSALQDPRTRLVHWPTYAIVERGVRGVDGVEYRFDTLVIGTSSKYATATDRPASKESA